MIYMLTFFDKIDISVDKLHISYVLIPYLKIRCISGKADNIPGFVMAMIGEKQDF